MCIRDQCLSIFFLSMTLKIIIYHLSFLSFLTFYVAQRPFANVILCFSWWRKNDIASEIKSSDVTFNAACKLSQPIGKTEFPAPLKIEQILSHSKKRNTCMSNLSVKQLARLWILHIHVLYLSGYKMAFLFL